MTPDDSSSEGAGVQREVRDGDCMESIAEETGHFWRALWNHPDNAELKKMRKDPNVLFRGDVVVVPPLKPKTENLATTRVHRFRRKGIPSRLRVRFLEEGEPLADREYTLEVAGKRLAGKTDGDGCIDHPVPASATNAVVIFEHEIYTFRLGGVDPLETSEGIGQRLLSLGFEVESFDPEDASFRKAVERFQHSQDLPLTGEVDDATRARLRDAHGC